jgi:hypothetical protein
MKELNQHIKPEVAITKQAEQKKQVKLLGSLRPQPGQQFYQLDISTAQITLAEFDSTSTDLYGKVHKKLILKDGCMYVCAINKTVAEKKFKRMITQIVNRK